ncbi:uncharacterized protein LOC104936303 isoform X2 [Larimichthys crocea]|uniref:uncharacterized protein LOC104936303 isoform X2 n=1 Tax=Larimichthys crocea TaxID=215358 RepID=UPI000F5E5650|nr:uncharacterized protein LOC104936303 isoform X2 [Larimichthys crocea]
MKTSSASVLIGVSVLLLSGPTVSAVSLHVGPNRPQYFTGDSVSLSCVGDGQEADGWTLKRTAGGHTEELVRFNNTVSSIILTLRQSDTGVYWCETSSGQRSDQTTMTVADPKAPPQTSSPLSSSLIRIRVVVFSLVLLVLVAVLVLVGVVSLSRNQSDAVRHVQRRHAAGVPLLTATVVAVLLYGLFVSAASSVSVIRLFCHLVVCCPFCISTGLMMSICCSRKTGDKPAVSMETNQRVELDEEYDDIAADVTTEYDF